MAISCFGAFVVVTLSLYYLHYSGVPVHSTIDNARACVVSLASSALSKLRE